MLPECYLNVTWTLPLNGTHHEAVQAYTHIDRVCLQFCQEFRTRNNGENAYLDWRGISAAEKQNLFQIAATQALRDGRYQTVIRCYGTEIRC